MVSTLVLSLSHSLSLSLSLSLLFSESKQIFYVLTLDGMFYNWFKSHECPKLAFIPTINNWHCYSLIYLLIDVFVFFFFLPFFLPSFLFLNSFILSCIHLFVHSNISPHQKKKKYLNMILHFNKVLWLIFLYHLWWKWLPKANCGLQLVFSYNDCCRKKWMNKWNNNIR